MTAASAEIQSFFTYLVRQPPTARHMALYERGIQELNLQLTAKEEGILQWMLHRKRYVPVVDGFLTGRTEADRKGRPCDVMMNDARSFFFTDDKNGVLYYVWKE